MKEFFYEVFDNLPRQGPGSDEHTRKAFHIIPTLPPNPKIVDIGCGTGNQTLELARISFGDVTGFDNYRPYIEILNKKIATEGLENCRAFVNDMFELDLEEESIDLIWSEGAIYIMGFENGLLQWKKFLKSGGYLVISEIAWFEERRPKECQEFWDKEVPDMLMPDDQKRIIDECGYELVESFSLPSDVWWGYYYLPLQKNIDRLRQKYADNVEKLNDLDEVQLEIDIFKKYHDYYGYMFYIMRKKEML